MPEYVKYKKYNNLNGPDYTVPKSEIKKIVYRNGSTYEFRKTEIPTIKPK
jgi:hypothetical protein